MGQEFLSPSVLCHTLMGVINMFPFQEIIARQPVLRIWIRIGIRILRIRMFLGLLDPDPLVTDMNPDPDPSIIKQK
jgi:hypothetical protein